MKQKNGVAEKKHENIHAVASGEKGK